MNTLYPNYDVLAKWESPSFDDQTRTVLTQRLIAIPGRHFFTEPEWALLEAIVARVLPQPGRAEPIPITPWIDDMLHRRRGEGFRHDNMPTMPKAWHRGLAAIDAEAVRLRGAGFRDLGNDARDAVLAALTRDDVDPSLWQGVPAQRFFIDILVKTTVGVYYSHPAAWSEIGFGGPASPRGYVRLGFDARDAWEGREEA
jgi:hypothetical protein